jgi:N-acetylneuraminic acid mutarotase
MRYLNVCFLGLAVLTLASCSSSEDTTKLGNWVRRADYQGDARREAVSFVIGDTAYVGTGTSGVDGGTLLSSFYKYDATKDNWTMIASMQDVADPAKNLARTGATAFAAGGKGYVTTGSDADFKSLKDTWEYNPATNSWASKAAFPGAARYFAVGFSLKDQGYVGTGYDGGNNMSDFFRYIPSQDRWEPITSLKDKRRQAVAFVIKDSAYVVTGTGAGVVPTRMYVYDATNDTWREKAKIENATDESFDDDYSSIARYAGVAFVINNKGYVTTGFSGASTWEYDPVADRWTEKTAFDGASRNSAVGFSVKGRGFISTGYSSATYLDDLYEFLPDTENDTND